jgi:hypothetical protein
LTGFHLGFWCDPFGFFEECTEYRFRIEATFISECQKGMQALRLGILVITSLNEDEKGKRARLSLLDSHQFFPVFIIKGSFVPFVDV